MGQSLAEAAVRGNLSTPTIAEQKRSLLSAGDTEGLIALNHSIFGCATMMAKEDDADDADDDDGDDEDDSDDDEDDDSDDDEDEGKGKKDDPRDARIQELSAEAKKKRLRIRSQAERIAELEAENARLKGKGKKAKDDEDDDSTGDESDESKAIKRENEALKERLQKQTIRQEFNDIISSPKSKIKFKDPKMAFRLLDLDDVEVDEDGEVDGLEDAIQDLAKEAPYLLVSKDDKDEDDEDKPRRRTGQRTGAGRQTRKTANADALKAKYNIKR